MSDKLITERTFAFERIKQMQSLSLNGKVLRSAAKIKEFFAGVEGMAYMAFSGGLDSRVVLDIVRNECRFSAEEIPAVFVDTGLEYPDVRECALKHADVVLHPKMTFGQVVKKYGFPVVSKTVSHALHKIRTTKSDLCRRHYLEGASGSGKIGHLGVLPAKWRFLLQAPFPISDVCCDIMKKRPSAEYNKRTGRYPILGMRIEDSKQRRDMYLQRGSCNAFGKKATSWPIAFWKDEDVRAYIKERNLDYPAQYDKGATGTGCFACMFGCHMEKGENRFQRMYKENPTMWKACMDGFGLRSILNFVGEKIVPDGVVLENEEDEK